MAVVTHENSYVSTNNDMGANHEKAHDKQHKYQQDGEPNIETLTDNKPEDLSTDLALQMAQNMGLKTEDEWEAYNATQRPSRRKDSYMEYVADTAGNLIKSKRRSLDKGTRYRVKDKKTGKMVTQWTPLGKQKREQTAQELASIDKNLGIPIDGSLYYISNTMQYDQMKPEELKKYRQFERKTLEDFYQSKTFQDMNPGCFRAEVHFDENGAIHLQTQDVWYRVDSMNRAKYAKHAMVKDILIAKYGSEKRLNQRLDVLSYCHDRYDKKPGSKDRIGAPTVASKYWGILSKVGPGVQLTDKARTDENGKVWPYRHSPKERDSRLEELWRMEQMKTLAEIATENAKQFGINWKLDQTYTTDGIHKTGSAYIQHKETMKGVNTEKVAVGKKVNQLTQQATKQQAKTDKAVKAEQDATNALKIAYEATTGHQATTKDGEELSPLDMSKGIQRAVTAYQKDAETAKTDEATATDNLAELKKQVESQQSARDEAQQQLERLQQRIRQRQRQRREELQEEINSNNLMWGGKSVDVTNTKTVTEEQVTQYQKQVDQWKKDQRNRWKQDKADHNKLVTKNDTLKRENVELSTQNANLKQDNDDLMQSVRDIYQTATGEDSTGLTVKELVNGAKSALKGLADKVKSVTQKLDNLTKMVTERNKQLSKEPSVGQMVKFWIESHWRDQVSHGYSMYGTGMESRINEYALNKQNNGEASAKQTLMSGIDNMISHDEYVQHRDSGTLGQYHKDGPVDDNRQF